MKDFTFEERLFGGVRDEDLTDEQRADMQIYYDHIARAHEPFIRGVANAYVSYGILTANQNVVRKVSRNKRRRWLMLRDPQIERNWANKQPIDILRDIEALLRDLPLGEPLC